MGNEMTEFWRDVKEAKKLEKEENLRTALGYFKVIDEICLSVGLVAYRANEYHYVFKSTATKKVVIQWWPSTKKWLAEKNKKKYHGNPPEFIDFIKYEVWK